MDLKFTSIAQPEPESVHGGEAWLLIRPKVASQHTPSTIAAIIGTWLGNKI